MKRLLRISFNFAIFSFIPILSWFVLGLLVDKSLTNVFMLTYPLQFIWAMMSAIFGTGANLSKEKDKNSNAVLSGMTLGIIIGFLIFGFIALNIESYIKFMNMDVFTYKEFALYSVIQLYIQLVFQFSLEKLYFEDKEKLANKYCLTLNILNLIILIVTSLIFKEKMMIVITTLLSIFIYVLYVTVKQYRKFQLKCSVLNFIKYNSADIFNSLLFFIIYLFGISNTVDFGEKYIVALNFATLITDTQWDTLAAIKTVAQIDISKNNFNYKEHKNNAYKLIVGLLLSSLILFLTLFRVYNVDVTITLIFLGIHVLDFIIYPIYKIKTCYLQLEWSSIGITTNKIVSSSIRTFLSFLKTPFCTAIGQMGSAIYELISVNAIFKKNYSVNSDGTISKNNKI